MTAEERKECKRIIEENEVRMTRLRADYDPITGRDAPGERALLSIEGFPVKDLWLPKPMFDTTLVHELAVAGSVAAFLKKYPAMDDMSLWRDFCRLRTKHDFCFWAATCIQIRFKIGGRGAFLLNYAQTVTLKELEDMRLSGQPINLVIDKARQWGGSTLCIFYQTWLTLKWDPFHSFAIAAHIQSASHNIFVMLKEAIADYPAWDLGLDESSRLRLAPLVGSVANAYVIKDDQENQVVPAVIYIGSAQVPDSLRSPNIAGVHYSEVGVWPNTPERRPEDLVADISGGMAKQRALSMQVMESTAKSADDYFHDVYTAAKRGESNYRAIFIPWYFIPHDTLPVKDAEAFALWLWKHRNDEARVGKWKQPGKYYWWLWVSGATLEGINWYMYEELNYTTRAQMVNEAPSSDVESFTAAGSKVFDFFQVEQLATRCKNPLFRGNLVSGAREGKDVLKGITFVPNEFGDLMVWEKPDPSPVRNRYVVAVDVGGKTPTSDFSSVRVMDRLFMMDEFGGRPNIVAEMHYHTDHDLLAYDAMRLAAWYNNALLVIESNTLETRDKERDTNGDGSEYILDIVGGIYPNLYMRHNKEEEVEDKITGKYGFHTNVYTKPKIIDNMRACLRDHLWDEPSSICCEEMAMYIDDHGKFTAPPKKHDDVLMATAILLWVCFKEMDAPKWIEERKAPKTRPKVSGNSAAHL